MVQFDKVYFSICQSSLFFNTYLSLLASNFMSAGLELRQLGKKECTLTTRPPPQQQQHIGYKFNYTLSSQKQLLQIWSSKALQFRPLMAWVSFGSKSDNSLWVVSLAYFFLQCQNCLISVFNKRYQKQVVSTGFLSQAKAILGEPTMSRAFQASLSMKDHLKQVQKACLGIKFLVKKPCANQVGRFL